MLNSLREQARSHISVGAGLKIRWRSYSRGAFGGGFPGRPTCAQLATPLFGRSRGGFLLFEWSFTIIKETPNPPETDDVSPYESIDSKKFHDAAERALNHYLNPAALKSSPTRKPSTMFILAPDIKD